MTAKLIDGQAIAKSIRLELKSKVIEQVKAGDRAPCLAVLLIGDDPASHIYVSFKEKACKEVGIRSMVYRLPASTPAKQVLKLVDDLNHNPDVDGILPQLPLPSHIERAKVIGAISPSKDVDGLTFHNQGLLNWNLPGLRPCTPSGIMTLLSKAGISCEGKQAVVIGRSILVGLPTALMLTHANASVTCIHSQTKNPQSIASMADILIAASGVANLVDKNWLKPGVAVIDVGINKNMDGKIVGDVNRDDAMNIASFVTPVPGGVGPMTIAMLLSNCITAWKLNQTMVKA